MTLTTATDPKTEMIASGVTPGGGLPALPGQFAYQPRLSSSDLSIYRVKDTLAAEARDASRSNPYGRSALRSTADAIIGSKLTLQVEPDHEELGVSDEEAAAWSDLVERRWEADAESTYYPLDAQRKQTFTMLMRTAYSGFYTSGEALATVEWKKSFTGTRTCMLLLDPERLSDPRGMWDMLHGRRMGVERDKEGAPTAFHIRDSHPLDAMLFGPPQNQFKWNRVERFTPWGRQKVLHYFEQDRPDMTRGVSSFSTALLAMRLLNDYVMTELESAAVRATYAAVIQSDTDYDKAMQVIGADQASAIGDNPILDFTLRLMAEHANYYRGQELRFGKSQIAHLLPNEELKMIQGTQSASALQDFNKVNLYTIASALGVDYATLTKDYSDTNYSGARAALFDVWRSYEVRRTAFMAAFPVPFYRAWLEEQVALRGTIPMLGSKSFYDAREAICRCTFETWGKPRLDPLKENQADMVLYDRGALSLREIAAADGRDWRRSMLNRKREKDYMDKLGLKPEDVDWELLQSQKKPGAKGEGTGSEGGASSGSSANG